MSPPRKRGPEKGAETGGGEQTRPGRGCWRLRSRFGRLSAGKSRLRCCRVKLPFTPRLQRRPSASETLTLCRAYTTNPGQNLALARRGTACKAGYSFARSDASRHSGSHAGIPLPPLARSHTISQPLYSTPTQVCLLPPCLTKGRGDPHPPTTPYTPSQAPFAVAR